MKKIIKKVNKPTDLEKNSFISEAVYLNAIKHCNAEVNILKKNQQFNKKDYLQQFNRRFLKMYQSKGILKFELI